MNPALMKRWDHPRVCGEKFNQLPLEIRQKGSPPRVRGKVSYHMKGMAADRITPACAGKSHQDRWVPDRPRDHPRVCGEKFLVSAIVYYTQGSPPRVRGKGEFGILFGRTSRITPACAGKRCGYRFIVIFMGDHPRVCGEKALMPDNRVIVQGSPPRVRGKVYEIDGKKANN